MQITEIDHGIIDGFHTVEVKNADTGETIGWNQTAIDQPPVNDTTAIADALAQLPQETLDQLKQALGL